MPPAHYHTPWYDSNTIDDDYETEHCVRREQLDLAWEEFLQAHGYKPTDTVTDEHWLEYCESVMYIGLDNPDLTDELLENLEDAIASAGLSYVVNMSGLELPQSESSHKIGEDPEASRQRDEDPQLRDWFRNIFCVYVCPESSSEGSKSTTEDSESDQAAQLISHKLTWEVLLLEAEREEQLTWDEQMAKSEKQKQLRPPRLSSLKQEEDKQTIVTAEANVEEKLDDTKLLTLGKRWSTFLYTSLPVTCVVC